MQPSSPHPIDSSFDSLRATRRHPSRSRRPLWVELTGEGRVHVFELRPGDERAILVGSLPLADVAFTDPGVAPVEFHLEREGDHVCLVPAYGARVEVDAVPLSRPRHITGRANIAFGNHVLRARVLYDPPTELAGAWPGGPNDTIQASMRFDALDVEDPDATTRRMTPRSPKNLDARPGASTAHETPAAKADALTVLRKPQTSRSASRNGRRGDLALVLLFGLGLGFGLGVLTALLAT